MADILRGGRPEEEPDPAQLFEDMAARIRRNELEEFAGAILIVPPPGDGNGDVVEVLLIDPNRDPINFWTACRYYAEKGEIYVKQMASTPPLPGSYGR